MTDTQVSVLHPSVPRILVLIACLLFLLAAFGIGALGGVSTVPLGLAFLAGARLV